MDIVFYTRQRTLNHKKRKNNEYYYWSMKHPPTKFETGDRVFFATNGYVLGSFECCEFNPKDPIETIVWMPESWTPLKAKIPLKRRHWRGVQYRWWDIKRKPEVKT
jgi:hypothetical protein